MREDMIMPYGKHKGQRICDMPSDYLKWMAETFTEKAGELNLKLCLSADREYQQRVLKDEL